jgi:TP901 family phage tail tape measure protein
MKGNGEAMSGHAVFTGEATQLFAVIDKIERRINELKASGGSVTVAAKLEPGAAKQLQKDLAGIVGDFKKQSTDAASIALSTAQQSGAATVDVAQRQKAALGDVAATAKQTARERVAAEKAMWAEVGRLERKSVSDSIKAAREKADADKKASQAKTKAERAAWNEIARLEKQARQAEKLIEKERQRAQKQALQEQKVLGASMAREIEAGYREAGFTVTRFGTRVQTVTGHLRQMQSEIRKAHAARAELLDRAGNASMIAGGAILGGAGISLKKYEDFDRSLRNVNSIAQLTESQLQKVGDAVMRLSEDPQIRKGPQDLTEALYDIYSSGVTGNAALETLRVSALGASAGLTETSTAAGVVLSVMQSGIGGVENQAQAMDVLFKTVDRGRLSFGDLASSLGQVLPYAAKAGVSLQEVGAFIAVATKQGRSASEAVNDLTNLLIKITNPSKEARGAFDKLGISYGYSALQGKGLQAVLQQIQDKTNGNADAIKILLPDMQAQSGALTALSRKGENFREELGQQARAFDGVGAAARAAAKQNQGAAYEADLLRKDFEKLSIEAAKSLQPALHTVVRELRDSIKWFNGQSEATQSNIIKYGAFAGAALLLLPRIKDVVLIVKAVKEMHTGAAIAAGAHAAAEELAATRTVTAWTAAYGRLASVLGNPITVGITVGVAGYEGLRQSGALGQSAPGSLGEAFNNYQWRLRSAYTPGSLGDTSGYDRAVQGEWAESEATRIFNAMRQRGQERAVMAKRLLQQYGYGPHRPSNANTATVNNTPSVNPLAGHGAGTQTGTNSGGTQRTRAEIESERAARQALTAGIAAQKKMLSDLATANDTLASATERGAKRQIDAIKGVHDALRDVIGTIEGDLRESGVTGAPLQPYIKALEDFLNLSGTANGVVAHYGDAVAGYRDAAKTAREAAKNLSRPLRPTPRAPGSRGTSAPADPRQFAVVTTHKNAPRVAATITTATAKPVTTPSANPLLSLLGGVAGLSTIKPLPKEWGPEIPRRDVFNAAQFDFQKLLQSAKGDEILAKLGQLLSNPGNADSFAHMEKTAGIKFSLTADTPRGLAAQFIRQFAEAVDASASPLKTYAELQQKIIDLLHRMAATTKEVFQTEKDRFDYLATAAPEILDVLMEGTPTVTTPEHRAELERQRRDIYNSPDLQELRAQADELEKIGKISQANTLRQQADDEYQKRLFQARRTWRAEAARAVAEEAARAAESGAAHGADYAKMMADAAQESQAAADRYGAEVAESWAAYGAEQETTISEAWAKQEAAFQAGLDSMKPLFETAQKMLWDGVIDAVPEMPTKDVLLGNEEQLSRTQQLYADIFSSIAHGVATTQGGFKGMVDSILQDLTRMAQEFAAQQIFRWLMGAFNIPMGTPSAPPGNAAIFGQLGLPLPSFAVGTPYVPRDMVAQIHRGEMIIPAAPAQAMRDGDARFLLAATESSNGSNFLPAPSSPYNGSGAGAAPSQSVHYEDNATYHFHLPNITRPEQVGPAVREYQSRRTVQQKAYEIAGSPRKGA